MNLTKITQLTRQSVWMRVSPLSLSWVHIFSMLSCCCPAHRNVELVQAQPITATKNKTLLVCRACSLLFFFFMGGGTYAINNLEILFLLKIFTSQGNASSPPLLVIRISHWHAQPYRTFGKKGGMGPNPEEDKTCSPWGRTFQGPGLSKRGAPLPDEPPEAGQAQGSWRGEFRFWMRTGPHMCLSNDPCWRWYEKNKYKEMSLPGLDLI